MSILDIVLLILLVSGLWSGYRQGLIKQLIKLVAFVFSFAIAFLYHKSFGVKLMEWFPLSKFTGSGTLSTVGGMLPVENALYNFLAFFILLVATSFLIRWLGGFLNGIANLPVLSTINRWLGGAVGLIKNGVILLLLLVIAYALPITALHQTMENSFIASYAVKSSPGIVQMFKDMVKKPEPKL
ncbi:CvpA family protein [Aneurinibacillus terranovensis]|uniref:CvpA family protein n=1 Tax=Aneurinibacillus terranovensis TaxID=278991 RepID=UPI0003F9B477|nr:CvpA family protein [Aneurinibacillus terranovensis]